MTQSLEEAMRRFEPILPMAVALSGGADSTALLLACAKKWPGQVSAWHVNHGLQAAAVAFEQHCVDVCIRVNVPLTTVQVHAGHQPGQSPEDAARQARYKAFSALAPVEYAQGAIQSIAIAQHADDQIETVLLALTRGAGLAGLSAMPGHWRREGMDYYRPLLQVSGVAIRAWLTAQGETFVEDPTNLDERFTRNRIRSRLMPVLQDAFPQFRDTFARSAAHAAQAQSLLEEVAALDLFAIARPQDGLPLIKKLQAMSYPRQSNTMRHWLKTGFGVVPSSAQLAEALHQVAACVTRGHRIDIKVGNGFLRRKGDALNWYNP